MKSKPKANHWTQKAKRAVAAATQPKTTVTLRMDDDLAAWYRATGNGYQSRINAILREFMEAARS